MKSANLKNAVFLTLTLGAAVVMIFSVILSGIRETDLSLMVANPELKPAFLVNGNIPPFDPAFFRIRPVDMAQIPLAARFDQPLGSEHGALTYEAQPFERMNREQGGIHLGSDLNGIGGNDSDSVRAIADGRVIFTGDAGISWGKMIILAHVMPHTGEITQSVYGHLLKSDVTAGMSVHRGDRIASLGKSDGEHKAHLHFEVRTSASINPAEEYFTEPLNREPPENFLKENRGAADFLLNPAMTPGKSEDEPVRLQ